MLVAENNLNIWEKWCSVVMTRRQFFCGVKVLGKLLQMLRILFILQNGVSALIIASQEGHYEVAEFLVEQGANVNLEDEVR